MLNRFPPALKKKAKYIEIGKIRKRRPCAQIRGDDGGQKLCAQVPPPYLGRKPGAIVESGERKNVDCTLAPYYY